MVSPTKPTKLQHILNHNTSPSSPTLAFLIGSFSLKHSYYSKSLHTPLKLHNYHSPYPYGTIFDAHTTHTMPNLHIRFTNCHRNPTLGMHDHPCKPPKYSLPSSSHRRIGTTKNTCYSGPNLTIKYLATLIHIPLSMPAY